MSYQEAHQTVKVDTTPITQNKSIKCISRFFNAYILSAATRIESTSSIENQLGSKLRVFRIRLDCKRIVQYAFIRAGSRSKPQGTVGSASRAEDRPN